MKRKLFEETAADPLQIKLTKDGITTQIADNTYQIIELFEILNEYDNIEIRKCGLQYKEEKRIRHNITGWISLKDFEYGGYTKKLKKTEIIK